MKRENTLIEIIEILTQKMEENEVGIIEQSELSQLTRKQIFYLDVIYQLKNPSLGELADKLKLSRPSITAIVDKLERSGYVRKVKSDEDRRSSHIHITGKGNKIANLHDKIHKGIADLFTGSMSKTELSTLVKLLNKTVRAME
jgi:DNA-binding MarR family transcriptional regulator